MHLQFRLVDEALTTLLADDRVIADLMVCHDVASQLLCCGECPGALVTLVTPQPSVDFGHMNLLVLLLSEVSLAVFKITG